MNLDMLYRLLEPNNWGSLELEPFEIYFGRVGHLLPEFPKNVMKQWIHRHYPDAISHYGWLDFTSFRFSLETWKCQQIYELIDTHKMDSVVDALSHHVYGDNWLQRYFVENRTWCDPIIILQNEKDRFTLDGDKLGQPYHLMEGHRRLGYFRRLFRDDPSKLKTSHILWIVTIEL